MFLAGAGIKRIAFNREPFLGSAIFLEGLKPLLEKEFGRGFGEKNLRRMIQFAEAFPDEKIVAALWRQLGWTHFKSIIPMTDPLKRDFYAEMCRVERWSTRTLEKKIDSMLFERMAQ